MLLQLYKEEIIMFEDIMFILLALIVLVYPQYELAREVYYGTHGEKPKGIDFVSCIVPFWNIIQIRRWMGSTIIPIVCGYGIVLAAIGLRAGVMLGWVKIEVLLFASVYGMIGALALIWICAAFTFVEIARCTGVGILSTLMCIIIPPGGAFLISNRVRGPLSKIRTETVR